MADIAPSILQHMNTDHADTLVLLAQHFGQCAAEAATMTAVDRLGFHLQVHNQHQLHGLRLPFIREIHQPDEVRRSLSTLSHKHPDWPFGSVMPYGLDEAGRPTFLISALAMHTQHLQRDPRASLLITQSDAEADPLGAARLTLMGTVTPVLEEDRKSIRERYLARHAEAKSWVDFGDFAFYRMDITDSYFVGGFGVMAKVLMRKVGRPASSTP